MNPDKPILEKIYSKPDAIWTMFDPPKPLTDVIESGKVKPCKALDAGCGEGFYSIYLASKGFDMTGVDLSENAIGYAKENASKEGANINFSQMDLLNLDQLNEKFGFVLEWAVMHHINPKDRPRYVENISRKLEKGGKYFSISFNVKSKAFGGPKAGHVRVSGGKAPGLPIYFTSQEELKKLFEPHFRITETKVFEAIYKFGRPHTWNYFLLEKL